MDVWKPIKTYRRRGRFMHEVDLWMQWGASPLTMGMADAFRVTEAWMDRKGKWMHFENGKPSELNADYITHWMPIPKAPKRI